MILTGEIVIYLSGYHGLPGNRISGNLSVTTQTKISTFLLHAEWYWMRTNSYFKYKNIIFYFQLKLKEIKGINIEEVSVTFCNTIRYYKKSMTGQ